MGIIQLELNSFGIFEKACISFDQGFTAITGESGSGKSTLVSAFEALISLRADKKWIRDGAEYAEILCVFEHTAPEVSTPLQTTLRKRIHRHQHSQNWINGSPCSNRQCAETCSTLFKICGQHSNLSLKSGEMQMGWLHQLYPLISSSYQALKTCEDKYEKESSHWNQQCEEFNDIERELNHIQEDLNYLKSLHPNCDEYERLITQIDSLQSSQAVFDILSTLISSVSERSSALKELHHLDQIFERLRPSLLESPNLTDLYSHYQDASFALGELFEKIEEKCHQHSSDQLAFQASQQRISEYQSAFRKFRVHTAEQLEALWKSAQEKLHFYEKFNSTYLNNLKSLEVATTSYLEASQSYLAELHKHIPLFESDLKRHLGQLGFDSIQIQVEIKDPNHISTSSLYKPKLIGFSEQIEKTLTDLTNQKNAAKKQSRPSVFWLWSHASHAFTPIHKTCSGGELSRIHLAVHLMALESQAMSTLICDEADSGLSGEAATKLNQYLQHQHAQGYQIMMITHLPQTAASADHHGQINKQQNTISGHGSAHAHFNWLTPQQRATELARLVSGSSPTEEGLIYAKSLIDKFTRKHPAQNIGKC